MVKIIKPHRQGTLDRRDGARAPFKRVLIVTEGTKTERLYFKPLIDLFNMPRVEVIICDKCDSAPRSVVKQAKKEMNEEDYDYVYCVFDRDTHETYEEAKSNILTLNKRYNKGEVKAITSIPCIEFWFYLHFNYSRAPIVEGNNKTCGENTVSKLKTIEGFKEYDKKLSDKQFNLLYENLETAITNAKRALKESQNDDEENPSSLVHILIEELKQLKQDSEQERQKSYRRHEP